MEKKNYILFILYLVIVFFIGDFTVSAIDVSACGTALNSAGATYDLTTDISSSGSCLSITANNVTLDCHGHLITYSTSGTQDNHGIEVGWGSTFVNNATVKNCRIQDGYWTSSTTTNLYRTGTYCWFTNYTTFINNTFNVSNGIGFYWLLSNYVNVTNNTVYSNYIATTFDTVYNSTLLNHKAISYLSNTGFRLEESSNNTLTNLNATSRGASQGLWLDKSWSNTLVNLIAVGSTYGLYVNLSNNTIIRDCINISGATSDIYYNSGAGSFNNAFINCSYNNSKETVQGAGNDLTKKWYYQAYVNNSGGTAVSDANVTAYNTYSILQFTGQTNGSGWIQRQELTEYVNTAGTRSYYNNYTINANKSGTGNDTNIFNFTTQQNKINDVFTLTELEDSTVPTINFESPTPSNTSSASSPVTIVANISDASNTSSWIDFDRSLLGYWAMDYYNATGIHDNSSYNNFGTFQGGLNYSNLTIGARGDALEFDGIDDYINTSSADFLPLFSQPYTFSLWINDNASAATLATYQRIISFANTTMNIQLGLGRCASSTSRCFYILEGPTSAYTKKVTDGNASYGWHHVVATSDGTAYHMYLDGVLSEDGVLSSVPTVYNTKTNYLYIGQRGNGGAGTYVDGLLDEVLIFNRTLSSAEIKALYSSQINKFNTSAMALADGQHNYTVYAIDEAGNVNNSGERNFNVISADSTSPTITFETPTPSNTSSTTSPVTIVANISDASNTSSWIDFDRSLLGYWAMDYYNATGIFDNSTYSRFGIFSGGLGTGDLTTGARGDALEFDGIDDSINTSFYPGTSVFAQEFSWTMWKKYNSFVANTGSSGNAGSPIRFYTQIEGTNGELRAAFGDTYWTPTTLGSSRVGEWIFISFVFDEGSLYTYIDGELVDTHPGIIFSGDSSTPFRLGAGYNGLRLHNGSIDEVMIFNRSLSSAEIKALYSSQINKFNTSAMTLADGQHNYTVYAIDEAGNAANSGWRNFLVTEGGTTVCKTLDSAGTTYTLVNNVSSTGTCFTVTAANVTLDCNGYWINYSTGGVDDTYGVYSNQFNTTVKNCNIVNGNWTSVNTARYGIVMDSNDNSLLFNNSVSVGNTTGIILDTSHFNNLTSNIVVSDFRYGIQIGYSSNNTLMHNTATSNADLSGIMIIYSSSRNNTLINTTGISDSSYGIRIYSSATQNTLINSTGISNSGQGIMIQTASGNNLTNCTGMSNSSYGFDIYRSSNNTLINCTGTSNTSSATYLYQSTDNTLTNQIARTLGTSGSRYGLYIRSSNNTIIRDCINISGATKDVYYYNAEGSINNTFINCSYSTETVQNTTNNLIRKWYYQAYVNNSGGTAVSDANVTAYNTSDILQFTGQTNGSGWIQRQEVTEYVNTAGTRSYYNNYTINANKSGTGNDTNIFNFTVTQNKLDDVFTLVESDSIPPYFTTIPANVSLWYGNQSLSVDFNADDAVGFGYFSINDSRFSITQAGLLSNATPMAIGNYTINITINDSSNNKNWTFYKVQVNKSNYYDCGVYFNATSPITFPATFIAYTNCSSAYTLYRNGTSISNASTINSGVGYYNLTVQRTDTTNYTNTVNTQFFTVNKGTPAGSISGTSPINYGIAANIQGTESNSGDSDVVYKLYRNGTEVSNPDTSVLEAGVYDYIYNTTGGANYTISASLDTFSLTVNVLEMGNSRVSLGGADGHLKITGGSRLRILS